MKWIYIVSRVHSFTVQQASSVFPQQFTFQEEDGHMLLVVNLADSFSGEDAFGQVQQECDRLFFLTGEQLNPKLLRIEDSNGQKTGFQSLKVNAYLVK